MAFPLDESSIDSHDPRLATLLSSIQGNILKGHGRDHTTNIFLRFKNGSQSAAKKWLAGFTENHLTTAGQQLQETERFKLTGTPGGLFGALYLSGDGYQFLGLDKRGG